MAALLLSCARTMKQPQLRFLFISAFASFCDFASADVTRGPYLQVGTATNITVRWRTDDMVNSRVRYGTNLSNLNLASSQQGVRTEHVITLTGLTPNTRY